MNRPLTLLLIAGLVGCAPSADAPPAGSGSTAVVDRTTKAPPKPAPPKVDWTKVPETELVSMRIQIGGMS